MPSKNTELLMGLSKDVGKVLQGLEDLRKEQTDTKDSLKDINKRLDALPCGELMLHKNDVIAHPFKLFSALRNMFLNGKSK